MYRVLIAEDDPAISELLEMNLTIAGYLCDIATDGKQALEAVKKQQYDLALLDIMLPEMDGFELLPYMQKYSIPVIYVSAKRQVADRVRGLRLGAEDYLVKPFDILELLVRMEKVLSRTKTAPSVLSIHGVTVWEAERRVEAYGKTVDLKPMEYALLLMFMKHPNIVMSREQLLREVWGDEYFGETRTVDNHVAILRKKLNWFDKIITMHRVGYKLEVDR
ncbi:MAG TPA: response regulator transcription factor [Clostridiales bacterium]|nr:response regulator transcription factor [Clostridiales bacterium]